MLAKVIKSHAAPANGLSAFAMPELGEVALSPTKAPAEFVFPMLTEIAVPEPSQTAQPAEAFSQNNEELVQDAREEAARIIAQAENDRVMIEQAALEKGLNEARAQNEAEIAARVAAEAADLRAELATTIEQVSLLAHEITAQAENELVELALQIARKIVAREVSLDREIACSLVQLALGKLQHRAAAEVRLHPEDFAFVEARRTQLGFRGALQLVADDSISRGGCLVHTDTGDIDARIESQFDEIAHGLLGSN